MSVYSAIENMVRHCRVTNIALELEFLKIWLINQGLPVQYLLILLVKICLVIVGSYLKFSVSSSLSVKTCIFFVSFGRSSNVPCVRKWMGVPPTKQNASNEYTNKTVSASDPAVVDPP